MLNLNVNSLNRIVPSYTEPNALFEVAHESGALMLLGDQGYKTNLNIVDQTVNRNVIYARAVPEVARNLIDSARAKVGLKNGQITADTYVLSITMDIGRYADATLASVANNLSIYDVIDAATFQGFAHVQRNGLLYGFAAGQNEGLLNTSGITAVTLPNDSAGQATLSTYNKYQLATNLLKQVVLAQARIQAVGKPFAGVLCMPQRVFGYLQLAGLAITTDYIASGSAVQAGTILKNQASANNGEFIFAIDDTLIGKGAGGLDAIVLAFPTIAPPAPYGTAALAALNKDGSTVNMYASGALPIKTTVPIAQGALSITYDLRMTSGWVIRPEAVTVITVNGG